MIILLLGGKVAFFQQVSREHSSGSLATLPVRLKLCTVTTVRGRRVHLVGVCASTHVRAGNTLVGVWCLFDGNLLLVALSRAAARGEEPKDARSEREGNTEPENGEHLLAHTGIDVIGLENCLEDADERRV